MDEQNVEVIEIKDSNKKSSVAENVKSKAAEVVNVAKETTQVVAEKVNDFAETAKGKIADTTSNLKNKTSEYVALTKLNVENLMENMKVCLENTINQCQELGKVCAEKLRYGISQAKEYNPHIKQTTKVTVEIYKNDKDEQLLHTNTFEKKCDVSASTILLAAAAAVGTVILVKSFLDDKD